MLGHYCQPAQVRGSRVQITIGESSEICETYLGTDKSIIAFLPSAGSGTVPEKIFFLSEYVYLRMLFDSNSLSLLSLAF